MQNNYKQLFKKLIKRSLYGMIIQCVFFASVFAQEVTVSGKVTSSGDGSDLPGVNVIVKGTTLGTTTDADGKYRLQVPDGNARLIFSFIGFVSQEIPVGARSVIDATLMSDTRQLSEVVVVGYGTQQKVNLTGAVSN